jgi:hypothetical protein
MQGIRVQTTVIRLFTWIEFLTTRLLDQKKKIRVVQFHYNERKRVVLFIEKPPIPNKNKRLSQGVKEN